MLTTTQNLPNQSNGLTELEIKLQTCSDLSVRVYDDAGRVVRSQTLPGCEPGLQTVSLDGRDDAGRPLASGLYFYRVFAPGSAVMRKMVIAR